MAKIKQQSEFVRALADGMLVGDAAASVGVDRATVRMWVGEGGEVAAKVAEAERSLTESVEEALAVAAMAGNVPAALAWLYNRAPDRWKPHHTRKQLASAADAPADKVEGDELTTIKIRREALGA